MSISESFDGETDFFLWSLTYEPDARGENPSKIEFEYARPSIGVDNKGRFITHEIIGGTTVRQKIGEDPRELSVSGVIKGNEKARKLDGLRDVKNGNVACNRLHGNAMACQFASISTSPIEDGGGVAIEDGKFLYKFSMKLVEI